MRCNALHYTTMHYTTLHYTTLHYARLGNAALHCNTLQSNAMLYTTLHCTALHCTALHHTALHCITLQHTLHYTMPCYTTPHHATLHYITLYPFWIRAAPHSPTCCTAIAGSVWTRLLTTEYPQPDSVTIFILGRKLGENSSGPRREQVCADCCCEHHIFVGRTYCWLQVHFVCVCVCVCVNKSPLDKE